MCKNVHTHSTHRAMEMIKTRDQYQVKGQIGQQQVKGHKTKKAVTQTHLREPDVQHDDEACEGGVECDENLCGLTTSINGRLGQES